MGCLVQGTRYVTSTIVHVCGSVLESILIDAYFSKVYIHPILELVTCTRLHWRMILEVNEKNGSGGPLFLEFWSPGPNFSPDQNFRDSSAHGVAHPAGNKGIVQRSKCGIYTVDREIFVVKKFRGCLKPRKIYTRNLFHKWLLIPFISLPGDQNGVQSECYSESDNGLGVK